MKNNIFNPVFFRIKQFSVFLLCLVFMTAVLPVSVSAKSGEQSKVVRVGWFDTAYNTIDSSGRRTGYSYDYQRKLASYTGWTYEYVEGSWHELMNKLKSGEIDMLSDVSYTKERAGEMLFPAYSMGTEEYYVYIAKNEVNEYEDDYSFLNGKKIGVNKGSLQVSCYKEWAEENSISADLVEVTSTEADSINMLIKGELDAYITIDTYLSSDTIVPVAKVGYSDFYFVVSKAREDLLDELNDALSKIQDENRFYSQELYAKYIRNTGANIFLNSVESKWLLKHGSIRVGYLDNYLAYCEKDKEIGKLTGALKDYLQKASDCFANAHIEFETKPFETIEKALQALKNGEIDCVFPVNISAYDGEQKKVIITPSLAQAALFMLVRTDIQETVAQKKDMRVAVRQGDPNYESIIKDFFPDWQMVTLSDTQECLEAVANDNADCFLISNYRYNNLSRLCEKYRLTTLDTGKNIGFSFAVSEGDTELYSILAKTTNIVPETYVETALSRYFSEEANVKTTLLDFIRDNLFIVIAVLVLIIALLLLIFVQNRLIKAERKAKENLRIADDLSRHVDALTSVRNKGGYSDYITMLQERLERNEISEFAVCMFDCDDLKYINDKFGHEKGDEYLKSATRLICQVFQHSPVFRIGGDEFISILQNEDYQNREELLGRFSTESQVINEQSDHEWKQVNVSVGIAVYDPKTDNTVEDTASRADQLMYENKRRRKSGRSIR